MAQTVVSRDLGVPDGPDDVTPAWLTEVLRCAGVAAGAPVIGFDVEPLVEGRGVLGRMIRLQLHFDGAPPDAPASLLAKLAPADPAVRAAVRGWCAREVRFYGELAGAAPLRTPRCYYGAVDEASGGSVLILEDLAALRPGDNLDGCSLEDAALAVRQIARFHARWWEHQRTGSFDWLPVIGADPAAMQEMFQQRWQPFLAAWGSVVPDALRVIGERLAARGATIWEQLAGPPCTIVHGDFHLANLLFDCAGAPEPLVVLDWQLVSQAKGAVDVAYFAGTSLPPHHRRAWEQLLVETYHAALIEHGVRGYDLARCLDDYRFATFVVAFAAVWGGVRLARDVNDFSNPRGRTYMLALIDRSAALLEDARALLSG